MTLTNLARIFTAPFIIVDLMSVPYVAVHTNYSATFLIPRELLLAWLLPDQSEHTPPRSTVSPSNFGLALIWLPQPQQKRLLFPTAEAVIFSTFTSVFMVWRYLVVNYFKYFVKIVRFWACRVGNTTALLKSCLERTRELKYL